MEELIKYIESENWTMHSKIEKRGVQTELVYIHLKSHFTLHISAKQFNFKAPWKLFKFESGWIDFVSIPHFKIFENQAGKINDVLGRYQDIRK